MDGTAGLEKSKNFDEWLSIVMDSSREEIASAKAIIYNGSVLENEVSEDKRITQRYWIFLFK
ncbi:acetyltransferase [Clostridium botulinum]|uniref:Acetyltransferase n=1 Tax=Clostridium botulinum TaxID=1491 RepID=A0A846J063_CLOBO|nr:acetyltransferase, GNAT family [Clostridium botulinum A3 str. Loch Maree]NFH64005.1 acetyltransferase [Clostridium botulinum]NFJ07416.1 acetyltransferase [Clostridium botulinum]NFK14388.1 acetyltransferase [Clostridium botulinum]NFM92838.1 acetyltransferase [Clostridium botulinum]